MTPPTAAMARPAPRRLAQAGPKPASRGVLKTLRRVHLYTGLALLPWVLLYGLTALLFNHAGWMSDARELYLDARELRAAGFTALAPAEERAAEIVRELGQRADGGALRLVPGSANWIGSVTLNGKGSEREARFAVDPALRGARVVIELASTREAPAAWSRPAKLELPGAPSEAQRAQLAQAAVAAAAGLGEPLEEATLRRIPDLGFRARDGEREYACTMKSNGELETRPYTGGARLREKLLRLHVQHGDPGYAGARSLWSWIVDAMGIAMILWAVSGLLMWWPMCATRVYGTIALVSGVAAMGLLALSLWRALSVA